MLPGQSGDTGLGEVRAWLNELVAVDAGAALGRLEKVAARAAAAGVSGADLAAAIEATESRLDQQTTEYRSWYRNNTANLLQQAGHYAEAIRQLSESAELLADRSVHGLDARDLLASLYLQTGQAQAALDIVEPIAEDAALPELSRADAHGSWALALADMGLLDQAVLHARRQAELVRGWQQAEDDTGRRAYLRSILVASELDLRSGNFAAVVERMKDEITRSDSEWRARFLVYLGVAQSGLERATPEREKAAYATLTQALESPLPHDLHVRAELTRMDLALREDRLETASVHSATLESLLQHAGVTTRDRDLFESHKTRLLRATESAQLRQRLTWHRAASERLFALWAAMAPRRGGVGFLHSDERREILGELVRAVEEVDGREAAAGEAFALLMRAQALASLARERRVSVSTLDEVRRTLLRPGQGLLLYLPARRRSHLVAVDADTLTLHPLADSRILLRAIRTWQPHLPRRMDKTETTTVSDACIAGSREVGDLLLPAAVRRQIAGWSTVTVCGADLLDGVPFECLTFDGEGRLLGECVPVDNLFSVPFGVHLVRDRYQPRAAATASARIFATLGAEQKIDPALLEPLRGRFERSETLLDGDVTLAALKRRQLHADLNQLVVHGVPRYDRERGYGLALASDETSDGFLGALEIEELTAANLVILSACRAGRGPARVGDGDVAATLAGACLRAGAHTVVHSTADLDLERHLELLAIAYRQLAGGGSTAAAFQEARAALARRYGRGEAFRQGLVQVVGLGHLPLLQR